MIITLSSGLQVTIQEKIDTLGTVVILSDGKKEFQFIVNREDLKQLNKMITYKLLGK